MATFHVGVLIAERHERIAAVARHEDVLCVIEQRDAVRGRVRLDGAPMLLGREPRQHPVERSELPFEPGRVLHDRPWRVAIGPQHLGDDRLHPRGPAFGRDADEDVARSRLEAGPAAIVEEGVPVRTQRRDVDRHGVQRARTKSRASSSPSNGARAANRRSERTDTDLSSPIAYSSNTSRNDRDTARIDMSN